ncbi:DUF2304 domain-containing protein [Leucobacter sp. NPDC058333]|uniref:DUF2304 domain-containing protein n=1 Tax=Leucobacter sp. NPDC058333 TaxID=3346450 RepID=UPI003658C618
MIIAFGAVLAIIMVAVILVMLAKRQLSEKYAVMWLVIGIAAIIVTVVPGLLEWLTDALHVQVPANLLFGGAIVLLVGVALHLSWELSRAEAEIRRLAEDVAINRLEVEQLAARLDERDARGAGDAGDAPGTIGVSDDEDHRAPERP